MISYREKQLLAVMKYMQNQTNDLAKNLSEALDATETGKKISLACQQCPRLETFEELCDRAADAGYDTFIRAEDILSAEEIEDLERHREDIEKEFKSLTKLRDKDIPLLFLGIGLQTARWAIITTIKPLSLDYTAEFTPREERLEHDQGDDLAEDKESLRKMGENRAIKKLQERNDLAKEYGIDIEKSAEVSVAERDYSDDGFRSVQQILFRPVPYDAVSAEDKYKEDFKRFGKNINGTNHRAFTLGHDPVWGWIIGPINILTRSITFKDLLLTTFPVQEKGNKILLPQTDIFRMCHDAVNSIQEDKNRLAAAGIKQALHFAADKYTKGGLPIPFISAEKAQQLIERDWNSVEAEKWIKKAAKSFANDASAVALQFFLSHYINEILGIIHILISREDEDYDPAFLEVRTRRIISISSSIASGSNIIYALIRAYIEQNPVSGVRVLDIGGIVESTYRLISNTHFILKIKDDYIKARIAADFKNRLQELAGECHGEFQSGTRK